MTGEIEIRKAEEGDIEKIIEVSFNMWGKDGVYSYEDYIDIISQNLSYVAVVMESRKEEDDNFLIGFCLVRCLKNNFARIFTFGVEESFRGKGLGKLMMKTAMDNCISEHKINNLSLHVEIDNKIAIQLYQNLGYEVKMIKKGYYENVKDAYYMEKII